MWFHCFYKTEVRYIVNCQEKGWHQIVKKIVACILLLSALLMWNGNSEDDNDFVMKFALDGYRESFYAYFAEESKIDFSAKYDLGWFDEPTYYIKLKIDDYEYDFKLAFEQDDLGNISGLMIYSDRMHMTGSNNLSERCTVWLLFHTFFEAEIIGNGTANEYLTDMLATLDMVYDEENIIAQLETGGDSGFSYGCCDIFCFYDYTLTDIDLLCTFSISVNGYTIEAIDAELERAN